MGAVGRLLLGFDHVDRRSLTLKGYLYGQRSRSGRHVEKPFAA